MPYIFYLFITVSFNEAQEESNNLVQSVKNGELQNSKIRRKQVTEADNNLGNNLKRFFLFHPNKIISSGLSKGSSFTSQGDQGTSPSTRPVGSPLLAPSTSYVGQNPGGFYPSAQSSPQSGE